MQDAEKGEFPWQERLDALDARLSALENAKQLADVAALDPSRSSSPPPPPPARRESAPSSNALIEQPDGTHRPWHEDDVGNVRY